MLVSKSQKRSSKGEGTPIDLLLVWCKCSISKNKKAAEDRGCQRCQLFGNLETLFLETERKEQQRREKAEHMLVGSTGPKTKIKELQRREEVFVCLACQSLEGKKSGKGESMPEMSDICLFRGYLYGK